MSTTAPQEDPTIDAPNLEPDPDVNGPANPEPDPDYEPEPTDDR